MNKYLQLKNLAATLTITLVLLSCVANPAGKSSLDLSNVDSRNMQIDSTLANDATLEAFIAPYRPILHRDPKFQSRSIQLNYEVTKK